MGSSTIGQDLGGATGRAGSSDLKSRVLQAARTLFFTKGYSGTSTREIAQKAETSESGVFRMYASKYDILMAVYNDCWGEVNAVIEERISGPHDDPRKTVLNIIRIVWELYEERPLLMSFIIINTGNTDTLLIDHRERAHISEENMQYVRRIEGLCQKCVNGGLALPGLTSRALCEGILGITEGTLLGWYLADHTKDANDQYPNKIGVDEALALIATLLYGTTTQARGNGKARSQGHKEGNL